MARFEGKLASAEGRLIAKIRGDCKKSPAGWTGTFQYPADVEERLSAPNPYHLRLDDGRTLVVKLTIVGIGDGLVREAHFHAGVEKKTRQRKS